MAYESESYAAPKIVQKFQADPNLCTDDEIKQVAEECKKAAKESQVPAWVGQALTMIVKLGKAALLSLLLAVVCLGCAAPKKVQDTADLRAKIFVHAVGNLDKREAGWQAQVRESESKDIDGRFLRDVERVRADAALDKSAAIDQVLKLQGMQRDNRAKLESSIAKAALSYLQVRGELIQVMTLDSALDEYIHRKGFTDSDAQALIGQASPILEDLAKKLGK